jgi:hypothetical protein
LWIVEPVVHVWRHHDPAEMRQKDVRAIVGAQHRSAEFTMRFACRRRSTERRRRRDEWAPALFIAKAA